MADEKGRMTFDSPSKRQKLDHDVNFAQEDSAFYNLNPRSRPHYENQSQNFQVTGADFGVETPQSQPWQAQLIGKPEIPKTDTPCEPGCSPYAGVNNDLSASVIQDDGGDCSNMTGIESDSDESLDLQLGSWQPELEPGPMSWVQQKMLAGVNPKDLLNKMLPQGTALPEGLDEFTMWKIIISILSEPKRRKKLDYINTMEDVLHLLQTKSKIIVLTGAGVSVSCGIPDFRSRDGIYARLAVDFPDLPDPQAMFDISYFWTNPRPFYKFAKEIYPGQFKPSASHKFIALLEQHGKLLRNYTQNIDTLEQAANITRVVQCHGSFATASCTRCHYQVDCEVIRQDIFNQVVPRCPRCQLPEDSTEFAVMKPDIVFFGEGLPATFHKQIDEDREEADLLIVIGSSLKVRPVALIPHSIPSDIPQILINREPLPHMEFDVELLGNCDGIVNELCHRLGPGFNHLCSTQSPLTETKVIPRSVYECMATPPYDSEGDTQFTFLDESSQTESTANDKNEADITSEVGKTEGGSSSVVQEHSSAAQKEDREFQATNPERSQEVSQEPSQEVSQEPSQDPSKEPNQEPSKEVKSDIENRTIDMQNVKPKTKDFSIAGYLPENTYLHIPPCRYVFKGAEVYPSDCVLNATSSNVSDSDQSNMSSQPNDEDSSNDMPLAMFGSNFDGHEGAVFDASMSSLPSGGDTCDMPSAAFGEHEGAVSVTGNNDSERLLGGRQGGGDALVQSQECGKSATKYQEGDSVQLQTQGCERLLIHGQNSTEPQVTASYNREQFGINQPCGQQNPDTDRHIHSYEKLPHIQSLVSDKLETHQVQIQECQKSQVQMHDTKISQVQIQDTQKPQIQHSETPCVQIQDSKISQGQIQDVQFTVSNSGP